MTTITPTMATGSYTTRRDSPAARGASAPVLRSELPAALLRRPSPLRASSGVPGTPRRRRECPYRVGRGNGQGGRCPSPSGLRRRDPKRSLARTPTRGAARPGRSTPNIVRHPGSLDSPPLRRRVGPLRRPSKLPAPLPHLRSRRLSSSRSPLHRSVDRSRVGHRRGGTVSPCPHRARPGSCTLRRRDRGIGRRPCRGVVPPLCHESAHRARSRRWR
jgi:hypothetical protein